MPKVAVSKLLNPCYAVPGQSAPTFFAENLTDSVIGIDDDGDFRVDDLSETYGDEPARRRNPASTRTRSRD